MAVNLSWGVLAILSGLIWFGFVLHTSGSGADLWFDRYTDGYAGFLVLLTMGWLALLYWGWRKQAGLGLLLKGMLGSTIVTLTLAGIVVPIAYIYLHQRSLDKAVFSPLKPEAHAFFQIDFTPDPPQIADDGEIRILALGGSTTWGSKLERNQAYPAQLEAILRARFPGKKITVLNAGVPWHTSMHSLLRYVGRFSDWKPHAVIIMHAFNDIFQASEGRLAHGVFRRDYGHFFGALGERVNPSDRFSQNLGKALTNNRLVRNWYSDLREPAHAAVKREVDLLMALPTFRNNLAKIARIAATDGARVIMMTQPYLYHANMTTAEKNAVFYPFYYRDYAQVPSIVTQMVAMDTFNQATREIARQSGATLIDLEPRIPKNSNMMYDDVHYTALGAARVAELVSELGPWPDLI